MPRDDFSITGDHSIDDSLTVSLLGDRIHIRIDEPWAGDSESGFGMACSFNMDAVRAEALCAELMRLVAEIRSNRSAR